MSVLKKVLCAILLLSPVLFSSGCWNNRDITDLGIVAGLGVDKAADGNFIFTVQVISNKSSAQASSGQSTGSFVTVSTEGDTVFDAARNLIPKLSKKAYYSQIQLMVIGETCARQGLDKMWDFFERDHEVNRTFKILVVKDGTAKSVLETGAKVEQIGAVEISNTVDNEAFGKSVKIMAFRISELLSNPLAGIVTGVVEPDGAHSLDQMKVQGAAVFRKAKLVGFLDNDETRGYLFAANQLHSTILTVKNPEEAGRLVSLEVISSTGKLTAGIRNGEPQLGIEIRADGNIGEEQGAQDLTDDVNVKKLEIEAENLIKSNIRGMLQKTQRSYGSDVLNFNDILYKQDNKEFEKIKKKWDKLFANAVVKVSVDFEIKRPGIIRKPAYAR